MRELHFVDAVGILRVPQGRGEGQLYIEIFANHKTEARTRIERRGQTMPCQFVLYRLTLWFKDVVALLEPVLQLLCVSDARPACFSSGIRCCEFDISSA
jgi:hypothetical protein